MIELATEILIYLAIVALIGFLLGFLVWGWGTRDKLATARAEGAAAARTSVDGDTALHTQMDACNREVKRLSNLVDAQKMRIAELEQEAGGAAVDDLAAKLKDSEAARAKLSDDLAERDARIAELETTDRAIADPGLSAQLDAAALERERLELALEERDRQIAELTAQGGDSGASDRADMAELEKARIDALLAEQTARVRDLELSALSDTAAGPADADADADAAERARLEAELADSARTIADLEKRTSMAAAGDAALHAELEACSTERRRLEAEIAAQKEQITALERRASDAVIPQLAETPAEAMPAGPPPKSLLTERPDEVDDLKRIKGVGPVMEKVLNDKGVYLFHQVATFSPEDVAWVNEAIEAFPGRIERDEWVRQAQEMYREKYGRSHDED